MRLPSTSRRRRARIEIIPLIDIIFFLLATFVMVSLSMVKNQGVPVKLPRAATGQAQERATPSVTVTVTESNRVYLNKQLVDTATLQERLRTLQREQPDLRVVFNGDELAYYGDIIKVLDLTRKAGVDRISLQTTGAVTPTPEGKR